MASNIIFKKIKFINFIEKEFSQFIVKKGLFTFPAGPALANIEKSKPLLDTVEKAHDAFYSKNYDEFLNLINDSWTQKKSTSSTILKNKWIREMDEELFENKSVFAHKLCGAGNGGFFLTFSKKGKLNIPFDCVKIGVETKGVSGKEL